MLVGEGREGDGHELARLQPVHSGGVDGHRLLGRHIGAILEVVVLPLLLRLEVQPSQPPQVLAANLRMVHANETGTRSNPEPGCG